MIRLILSLLMLLGSYSSAIALSFNEGVERKLMCVGDSITAGTGSTDGFSYRGELQSDLGIGDYMVVGSKASPGTSTTKYIFNEGIGGDNVEDVNARIDAALDAYFPTPNNSQSVVLLYAGINDINASEDAATNVAVIADSPLTTASIVGKIHAHDPDIMVYVGLIQPSTNGTLNTNISAFNVLLNARLNLIRATKTNLHIVDINSAVSNTSNCATVSACMTDTLHPNNAGYIVIGSTFASCILSSSATYCDGN